MPVVLWAILAAILLVFAFWVWRLRHEAAAAARRLQPGGLARFWLWAVAGVLAMFGTFSFGAGSIVWSLLAALIGMLAARSVTPGRAALAVAIGLAAPALTVALDAAWPLLAGPPIALALAMLHSRRDTVVLTVALGLAAATLVALYYAEPFLSVIFAPVLVVLVALAVGRPQREAAGAITGAGLALFAFGAPEAGIPLTLAGAILMFALGLRRRRLAVSSA
jgi:hypothetical protein